MGSCPTNSSYTATMGVRKTMVGLGLLLCVSWCSGLGQHFQDPLRDTEPGHDDEASAESREASTNDYKEQAKFVLVLDNSNSMSSCNRMINLKYTMKRWVDGLENRYQGCHSSKFGS
eukprot:TRINITY_DN36064_c0_g1_i1.p1 TRINITY_DN36064_c0_g1~~TRINITY_DN36064_c0_g1_i1.p1  ORF type:complete len:125 (-),score=45.02 TRINITY_DN36064_c0_g1_i1:115-465(-)